MAEVWRPLIPAFFCHPSTVSFVILPIIKTPNPVRRILAKAGVYLPSDSGNSFYYKEASVLNASIASRKYNFMAAELLYWMLLLCFCRLRSPQPKQKPTDD